MFGVILAFNEVGWLLLKVFRKRVLLLLELINVYSGSTDRIASTRAHTCKQLIQNNKKQYIIT